MAVSLDGGRSWELLSKFAEIGGDERLFERKAMYDDEKKSMEKFLFLQGQLDLFGVLCNGRNEDR